MYLTPFSQLAKQCSHLRDVSLLEPHRRSTQSTRQESDVPNPSSPSLNEPRELEIVCPPSRVPRESAYICQFCSLCPLPSLLATSYAFSVIQASHSTIKNIALSTVMHHSRVSSPPPQPRSPTSRNSLPWVFILYVIQNPLGSLPPETSLFSCTSRSRSQKWMVLGFLILGVGMVQILRVVHSGSQASTSGWSPRLQGRPLGWERLVFRRFHSFLHCLPSSSPTTETLKDPPET